MDYTQLTVVTEDLLGNPLAGSLRVAIVSAGALVPGAEFVGPSAGSLAVNCPVGLLANFYFTPDGEDRLSYFIGSIAPTESGDFGTMLRTAAGRPIGVHTLRAAGGSFSGAVGPPTTPVSISIVNPVIKQDGAVIVPHRSVINNTDGTYNVNLPQTADLYSPSGEAVRLRLYHGDYRIGAGDFIVPPVSGLSFQAANGSVLLAGRNGSPLLTNLEAYWNFGNSASPFVDATDNGHDLAWIGPAWVSQPGVIYNAATATLALRSFSGAATTDANLAEPGDSFDLVSWVQSPDFSAKSLWSSDSWVLDVAGAGGGLFLRAVVTDADGVEHTVTDSQPIRDTKWNLFRLSWHAPTQTIGLGINGYPLTSLAINKDLGSRGRSEMATARDTLSFDDTGYWYGRTLTSIEWQALWNGGKGSAYPFA